MAVATGVGQLHQQLLQEISLRGFVSWSALSILVNEQSVSSCLRTRGIPAPAATVQEITTSSPKLFALLVLVGCEHDILECHDKNISDDVFPISTDLPLSMKLGRSITSVLEVQWKIPPRFEKFIHLDLPVGFIPPFLEKCEVNHGSFGYVYKVRVGDGHLLDYTSNPVLALKKIVKHDFEKWEVVLREVRTLRAREHPHIVPLLASYTENSIESEVEIKTLNLLFPYSTMDMDRWMYLKDTPAFLAELSSKQLKAYMYRSVSDIASGLAYLHREIDGVITSHHDLKPKNILLFDDTWKICDFGRSNLIPLADGSEAETGACLGTFAYNPPEYWDDTGRRANLKHGRAFDIWAMGCIIIELVTLAVHGWSSGELARFRLQRRGNENRRLAFDLPHGQIDDSFHNNMDVVKSWVRELGSHDGSHYLVQTLNMALSMLDQNPKKRPFSWEIELDLYELLNPHDTFEERRLKISELIQKPGPHFASTAHNPLRGAVSRGNTLRVKCLLDSGWPADGVDLAGITVNQLANSVNMDEIRSMLQTALCEEKLHRVFHKLSWRHATKTEKTVGVVHELSQRPLSSNKQNQKPGRSSKIAEMSPAAVIPDDHSQFAIQEPLLLQDADGLTSLHKACRAANFWAVVNLIEQLILPSTKARLLLLTDNAGKLALHHACRKSSRELLSLLLERFALTDTSYFYSASLTTKKDDAGRTPLHLAAQCGNLAAIEILVSVCFNAEELLCMRDDDSRTAWDLASKFRQSEAANLIADLKERHSTQPSALKELKNNDST
ncbi:Serine/threonine-protein kinase Nek7 [Trapelia coarctata]|nr:Serine/threonine-protein kinase Nek7 [Trapelia coarctata]